MSQHVLVVKNIFASYKKKPVLKNLSFNADSGKFISLLGKNGAGKTTLFKCILRFINYSGGIFIDDVNTKTLRRRDIAKLCAYIPQSHTPSFNYDVLTVVLMGTNATLSFFKSPEERHKIFALQVLESLGIKHLAGCGFCEISGGERQLVLIARALTQKAKIFIMDEPAANLDYGNQIKVLSKIKSLTQNGILILLSTHNPEQALRYSDGVLVLQDGSITMQGTPREVITKEAIEKIYGVHAADAFTAALD